MWKRIQPNKPGRRRSLGDGFQGDDTLGGASYGGVQAKVVIPRATIVNAEQSDNSRVQSVRSTQEWLKDLPPLPSEAAPVIPKQTGNRALSSSYPQPYPKPLQIRIPRNNAVARAYHEQVQISPPSSPEISAINSKQGHYALVDEESPDISPVDGIPDVSKHQTTGPTSRLGPKIAGSNIPVLRRDKRRNQIGAAATNFLLEKDTDHGNGVKDEKILDTRQDTLAREPATSERGQPQVKPSQFTPPENSIFDIAEDRGLGLRTTVSGVAKDQNSFFDRVKKLEDTTKTGARPEWKGSSGRSQVIPPVTDQVLDRPVVIEIPRKSSKRATSPRSVGSSPSTSKSVVPPGQTETSMVSPPASGKAVPARKPIVPPPGGQNSTARDLTSPASQSPQSSITPTQSYSNPAFNEPRTPNHYTPPMSSQDQRQAFPSSSGDHNGQFERRDSIASIERKFREALKDVNLNTSRGQPRAPEVSRFSVTTYATSTADSTPRLGTGDFSPMPTPPKELTSIVNRRRPIASGSLDPTKATRRKAVPSSPIFVSMSSAASASWRNSKMLPKSPPEAQSIDLITSLQAQLDNLANRRTNIQKSIHQMTHLIPTGRLARGMEAMRQAEEKKKVEMLKADLADVVREEHDLGLRLYRALKRRDEMSVYEPTSLWVRRVTG